MVISAGVSPSSPSSSPGAGGELVFKLDTTDTSQFEASAAFADGGGVGSLSIVSVAERGDALRLTSTAGTAAHLAFLAVDPIVFPDERRDLIFEMEVYDIVQGTGGYGGLVLLADDAGIYHAMNHLQWGIAEWASRVELGPTRFNNGSTGTGPGGVSGFVRTHLRGRKPAGIPPEVTSWPEPWSPTSLIGGRPRRSGSPAQSGGVSNFAGGSVLNATWNALACDRWGICIQSSGGNALPTNFDILDLRVYRL